MKPKGHLKSAVSTLGFSTFMAAQEMHTQSVVDIYAKIAKQDEVARRALQQSLLALPSSPTFPSFEPCSNFFLTSSVSFHSLRCLPSVYLTSDDDEECILPGLEGDASKVVAVADEPEPPVKSMLEKLGPFHYPGFLSSRQNRHLPTPNGTTLGLQNIYDVYANEFSDLSDPFFPWNWYQNIPVSPLYSCMCCIQKINSYGDR
jgi:hypothetical protein